LGEPGTAKRPRTRPLARSGAKAQGRAASSDAADKSKKEKRAEDRKKKKKKG
jgi:hypothetical protein